MGRRPRAAAQVGRARDVGARHDVLRADRRLPARAVRGTRPALSLRRLQDAAATVPSSCATRSSSTSRSGSASSSDRPTRACSTSGSSSSTRTSTPRTYVRRRPGPRRRDPSPATRGRSACSCAMRCSAGSSSRRSAGGAPSATSTARTAGTPRRGWRRWRPTARSTTRSGPGPAARGPELFMVEEGSTTWQVRQTFDDPEGIATGASPPRSTWPRATRSAKPP